MFGAAIWSKMFVSGVEVDVYVSMLQTGGQWLAKLWKVAKSFVKTNSTAVKSTTSLMVIPATRVNVKCGNVIYPIIMEMELLERCSKVQMVTD